MSRKPHTTAKECSPTPEDASKLIQACNDPIDRFILACAMYLGLDKGAIAHFRDSWVVMHENRIKIPDSQSCSKSCCKKRRGIWRPKGKTTKAGYKTYRNVDSGDYSIFPWATEAIKIFIASYKEFPLSERAINLRLDSMIARAKTSRRITVHGLRSFAASNLSHILKGDISKLCSVMGWEPDSPMAKVYVQQYQLKQAMQEGKNRSLI